MEYYAANIFAQFDRDRSGSLDITEFPNMINMFMAMVQQPRLADNQVMYLMFKYDSNKDGKIDLNEFKLMLRDMGGFA